MGTLITLLVCLIVLGLLWYLVLQLPLPHPFPVLVQIIVVLVAIYFVLVAFGLIPGSLPVPRLGG